jgi:hypothetical protein
LGNFGDFGTFGVPPRRDEREVAQRRRVVASFTDFAISVRSSRSPRCPLSTSHATRKDAGTSQGDLAASPKFPGLRRVGNERAAARSACPSRSRARPLGMRLTLARRELFLAELRKHGVAAAAARAASPHSTSKRGCLRTFEDEKARSARFGEQWDAAVEEANASIERELHRRAVEGWRDPVFQQGQLVGHVRKYSDRLLEVLVKARLPAFRERSEVAVTGNVRTGVNVDVSLRAVLAKLSDDDLAALDRIASQLASLPDAPAPLAPREISARAD